MKASPLIRWCALNTRISGDSELTVWLFSTTWGQEMPWRPGPPLERYRFLLDCEHTGRKKAWIVQKWWPPTSGNVKDTESPHCLVKRSFIQVSYRSTHLLQHTGKQGALPVPPIFLVGDSCKCPSSKSIFHSSPRRFVHSHTKCLHSFCSLTLKKEILRPFCSTLCNVAQNHSIECEFLSEACLWISAFTAPNRSERLLKG